MFNGVTFEKVAGEKESVFDYYKASFEDREPLIFYIKQNIDDKTKNAMLNDFSKRFKEGTALDV